MAKQAQCARRETKPNRGGGNIARKASRRESASAASVGIAGLGIMGGAFAGHLLAAGFKVSGFDVVPNRLAALGKRGGQPARSCRELAATSDIIITSLPSVAAVEEAYFGRDGIAAGARRGAIVIEASTLPLALKQRCHDGLAPHGTTVLDCPVSGTGAQAAVKDLVIYASGEPKAIAHCKPVFDAYSRATVDAGAFGNGSKLKYLANLLVTIHNLSAAEALVLGLKAGLTPELMAKGLYDSAGTSRMLQVRGPMMLEDRYLPATMKIDLYQKDIDIIEAFARELKCPTPLFSASLLFYQQALADGRGKQDTAAICAVLKKLAGLPVRQRKAGKRG